MGVKPGVRQYFLHDATRTLPAPLVLFLDNLNGHTGEDAGPVMGIGLIHGSKKI